MLRVLGSAAGGGFPQWNCNCTGCRRARTRDPAATPRTQSSLAVSSDGERWLVVNASPDLRQQILQTPSLHPRTGLRDSPIAAVFLTNADVDHIGGLLNLREGQPFALYAARRVLDVLEGSAVFNVLNRETVPRREAPLGARVALQDAEGVPLGLAVETFTVPGKVALFLEDPEAGPSFGTAEGDTVGLRLIDERSGRSVFYVPNAAAMSRGLSERLQGAELVFFDGTLYRDDEMLKAGLSGKSGRRMGHISVSGPDGAIASFEGLSVKRKIFVHINNSNPILLTDSPEREAVESAGWEVACDGMEIEL